MQSGQMRPSLPTVLTRICDGGNGRGDGDDDDKVIATVYPEVYPSDMPPT
jgi:hypothetical protein